MIVLIAAALEVHSPTIASNPRSDADDCMMRRQSSGMYVNTEAHPLSADLITLCGMLLKLPSDHMTAWQKHASNVVDCEICLPAHATSKNVSLAKGLPLQLTQAVEPLVSFILCLLFTSEFEAHAPMTCHNLTHGD